MQIESKLIMGNFSDIPNPDLSILIPTYGRAKYLEKAIESALAQKPTRCKVEIIIVSNNPYDAMTDLIDKYKNKKNVFIYRNEENIGMVGNSNRCAELARGKYIAFLHDDDYLLGNYIRNVEQFFLNKASEAKCFVVGRYILFEKKDHEYRNAVIKDIIRKIYFIPSLYRKKIRRAQIKQCLYANVNCYFSPSCGTVFEKKGFESVGGFNLDIPYSWDYDFFLRFNNVFQIDVFSNACAVYRIGNNASLRSEVKYDFYEYNKTKYLQFMRKNKIDDRYIKRYEKEIIYSIFQQWPEDLESELTKRNEEIPHLDSKMKWYWFKLKTLLYYYNNNLDIQRLLPRTKK